MVFDHDFVSFPELSNAQLADFGFSSPHKQFTEDFFATVVKVHDGDTVTLSTPMRDFVFPLRLLNIDAKELSEGGDEAKLWLSSRILNEHVMIVIDSNNRVGKYGRLLGRIFHQGLDVAEEMLNLGLVWSFDRRKEGPIPNIHQFYQEGAIP